MNNTDIEIDKIFRSVNFYLYNIISQQQSSEFTLCCSIKKPYNINAQTENAVIQSASMSKHLVKNRKKASVKSDIHMNDEDWEWRGEQEETFYTYWIYFCLPHM